MMKAINVFVLLVCLSTSSLIAQKINWLSVEEAVALQKKEPRAIMMDVYTTWCGPCKLIEPYLEEAGEFALSCNAILCKLYLKHLTASVHLFLYHQYYSIQISKKVQRSTIRYQV